MKFISFLFTGVLLVINTLSFSQDEVIFEYTGDAQTYVVPSGTTDIQIECWGAQGQALTIEEYDGSIGGLGGYAVGSTSVSPGDVLTIYVGGTGTSGEGGYNGGGVGGYGSSGPGVAGFAGSGGGASDVRVGGVDIADRIIVAGGGGGGGRDYVHGTCTPCGTGGNGGVGGGLTGGDGDDPGDDIYMMYYNPGAGGNGGTPIEGGAGGLGSEGDPGNPGVLNVGGDGLDGDNAVASGGGGGGYYGGGSGGGVVPGSGRGGGGGAGGSSFIGDLDDGETISGIRSGNGRVIITTLCVGLSLEPVETEICLGDEIILDASSETGGIVMWDGGVVNGEAFEPGPEGEYTYTATSTSGTDCYIVIDINVRALPIIESYIAVEELLGDDGSINITVSGGTPAYDFDWDNDGVGEFGDPEDLTGIAGGTYTVVVSDANGCEDTETIVVDSKLKIGQNAESVISVYPNPTNDRLIINRSGNFSVQLFSVNGDILLTKSGVNQMEISLSEFLTGIYLLEIEDNGEVQTVKVIKE